jgi:osmoprotectant transport system permease protein
MYEALQAGSGDVISAYSTDGRIAAYGLRVLEDDRRVIPPYDAIVLASRRFASESPHLVEAIAALEGRLDAEQMRSLNAAVDLEGKSPAAVAGSWVAARERGRSAEPVSGR